MTRLIFADSMEGQKASDKFYFDAKWSYSDANWRTNPGQMVLFAASAAGTLDVYSAK